MDDDAPSPALELVHTRLVAVETLVEMIWTDRLAQEDSPGQEAKELRKQVLGLVEPVRGPAAADPQLRRLDRMCREALEQLLDKIVHRAQHL
ncbi:hypothetical protein [Candidatus Palauibacter sp.]|uniref:hypothetical protein n=1 Tax=Candidatus Palauibacter sp. TaxID=3101350 RepID=UPI003CC5B450